MVVKGLPPTHTLKKLKPKDLLVFGAITTNIPITSFAFHLPKNIYNSKKTPLNVIHTTQINGL